MKKALIACCLLAGCNQGPQWQGWVYPDRNNLASHIAIGSFDSLEQCRDAALSTLQQNPRYEDGERLEGDYECGYKCKPAEGLSGNVCERTEH